MSNYADIQEQVLRVTDILMTALIDIDRTEYPLIEPLHLNADAMSIDDYAAVIDHTLLKPQSTAEEIKTLCAEALDYGFASVCVNLSWLPLCVQELAQNRADEGVIACVVVGFPLGATSTATKRFETEQAIAQGAAEVDMVINIGLLKGQQHVDVYEDIVSVVEVAHAKGVLVKVILETALLTTEEKIAGCMIAKEAGADFVKTSTGFNGSGATVDDIALMRTVVGPDLGVKASGGIRTAADAKAMVEAGATRIGASAGVAIVNELSGGKETIALSHS